MNLNDHLILAVHKRNLDSRLSRKSLYKYCVLITLTIAEIETLQGQPYLQQVYAVLNPNSGGTAQAANAQTYNPTTGHIISSAHHADSPTLYFINEATGADSEPAFLNYTHDPDPADETQFAGFSVGANNLGNIFYFDDGPARLQKLDNETDTQAMAVTAAGQVSFSRNLSIEGSGTDTWIASVGTGTGPDAITELFKAVDASQTSFTKTATIFSAGRAGVGISVPPPGQPPEWVATADLITIKQLHVFQHKGLLTDPNGGYELHGTSVIPCAAAQFDLAGDDSGKKPVIFALTESATTGASVRMYGFDMIDENGPFPGGNTLNLIDERPLLIDELLTQRGSLNIDRTNKVLYATYRGVNVSDVIVAKIAYTLPPAATGVKDWSMY